MGSTDASKVTNRRPLARWVGLAIMLANSAYWFYCALFGAYLPSGVFAFLGVGFLGLAIQINYRDFFHPSDPVEVESSVRDEFDRSYPTRRN